MLSPLAKNLFHRAISESSMAFPYGLVKADSKAEAQVGPGQPVPRGCASPGVPRGLRCWGPAARPEKHRTAEQTRKETPFPLTLPLCTAEQTGPGSGSSLPKSASDGAEPGLKFTTLDCQYSHCSLTPLPRVCAQVGCWPGAASGLPSGLVSRRA